MSSGEQIAPDAAMALGIAATALPFTRTRQAAVEHWLRVLRLHGEAGAALQSLGVGEERLLALTIDAREREEVAAAAEDRGDLLTAVAERARLIALSHDHAAITTADLLLAVIEVYGADCDRVLVTHGTDRAELLQRLGRGPRG